MKRCLNCGKEIPKRNATYCSRACRNKHLVRRDFEENPKYPRTCKVCGKEFLAKRPNRMYCSVACNKHAEYRRRVGPRRASQSKIWRAKRMKVFLQQEGKCWLCDKDIADVTFNLHHTTPGDHEDESDDVVALCVPCHSNIHKVTVYLKDDGTIGFVGEAIKLLQNKGFKE